LSQTDLQKLTGKYDMISDTQQSIRKSSKKAPYGTVTFIVKDNNGSVIRSHSQNLDSFLINHERLVLGTIKTGATTLTTNSINNTSMSLSYNADLSNTTETGYNGIIVGTGDKIVEFGDLNLDAIIDHGTGAGQLSFKKPTVRMLYFDQVGYLERDFVNLSGSAITIKECGISKSGSNTTKSQCALVVRDVLTSPIIVDNNQTLSVIYELRTTKANINWFMMNIQALIGGLVNQPTVTGRRLFSTSGVLTTFTSGTTDGMETEFGNDTEGIVVSTNTNTGTYLSYEIPDRIRNGINTSNLIYGNCNIISETYDNTNGTAELIISREFLNHSNANITIGSVGLRSVQAPASVQTSFVYDWTKLAEPLTLENGNSETFTYRFCYEL
jgi:hypothetical protein